MNLLIWLFALLGEFVARANWAPTYQYQPIASSLKLTSDFKYEVSAKKRH